MAEIAEDMREGLLALAVGAGLQVMTALMVEDVTAVCGPKGRHEPERAAVRHGGKQGSVTLGRCRALGRGCAPPMGPAEVPVPAYELFSATEVLGRTAMQKMLAGLSTRSYRVGLEPGQRVEDAAAGSMSKPAARRFVAATETALAELLATRCTSWIWWR